MCMSLHREWFSLRREFDELHSGLTSNEEIREGIRKSRTGDFEPEHFLGYCEGEGKYMPMVFPEGGFDIQKLYPTTVMD